jgi:hypothetical protein
MLSSQSKLDPWTFPNMITAFTGNIDDPACLKQMALVKAPLKTKYDGKLEHLRTHIMEFLHHIQNTGLYHEFDICTQEFPRLLKLMKKTGL